MPNMIKLKTSKTSERWSR